MIKVDPEDIVITFNGIEIKGFALDEFVEITYHPGYPHNPESREVFADKKTEEEWNDRCKFCNKGIYRGFDKVEHEGGPCK